MHEMVFPRLVALAERAWHRAEWEGGLNEDTPTKKQQEWQQFVYSLTHRELYRLDQEGIKYSVPPPGAR